MITVIHGKDYRRFFTAHKNTAEIVYKQSRYLFHVETVDGTLVCNTMTGALVLLSPEESTAFYNLPAKESAVLKPLIFERIAVPLDCREESAVDQLRTMLKIHRTAKRMISQYIILPTTFCNARCFYCYESGFRHVSMTDETADQLVSFIAANCGLLPVKLNWFGGEPTLAGKQIDRICGGLDALGICYTSDMVSNGFLFDADRVRHAREAWKLKSIQITLDGTEEIYNRTKAYRGVQGSPFLRVLDNISLFLDAEIRVSVRLNMDSHNAEDLETLIEELGERFANRKHLSVYVRRLTENVGFKPICHQPKEKEVLNHRLVELKELLEQKGWPQYRVSRLPSLRITTCMADNPLSVLCTPEGMLSKCENDIEEAVGTLKYGITDTLKVRQWQERKVFESCDTCPLYPSCNLLLKNCPVNEEECNQYDRERTIASYQNLMLESYQRWKETGTGSAEDDISDETGRQEC